MVLNCSYEEITALSAGARGYLDERGVTATAVAAPTAARAAVESLLHQLTGDLSLTTLAEQIQVERAVTAVVDHLRVELESRVLATHPADEFAVIAYFDFAHVLSVLGRVREIGHEMSALVEVITGTPPDEVTIEDFVFPD